MTLRKKILIALCITLVALIGVLHLATSWIVVRGFEVVENEHVQQNVLRALEAIRGDMASLHSKSADWAIWDDAYNYMHDRNPQFVSANLGGDFLQKVDLDSVIFLDTGDKPVLVRTLGSGDNVAETTPPGFDGRFNHIASLARNNENGVSGLVRLADGVMMFSARPIVPTLGKGEPHGTLIFAHRLNKDRLARVANATQLVLDLRLWNDGALPTPWNAARATLTRNPSQPYIQTVDENTVQGFGVIEDADGQPLVMLRAQMERPIFQQAKLTSYYLTLSITAAAAVFGVVMLLLVERSVLSPITRLNRDIAHIGDDHDISRRLTPPGGAEIASVVTRINEMLDRLQAADAQLIAARDAAEEASRAKGEFLANMSHEIRTPMTAILGFSDLLLDPRSSQEDRVQYIHTIRRNGQHLLAVINDILDLSKIESGKMTAEVIGFNPAQVVHDVVSMMHARAKENKLELGVDYVGPLPEMVRSDPTRLRQILVNLVGNAIKFTKQGGVRLVVRTIDRPVRGGEPRLRFEVVDTGIGITPEQQERLFQPFAQADTSTTRAAGGTGLGLYISRKLARLLGGELICASASGEGSTFTFEVATGSLEGVRRVPNPGDIVRLEAERAASSAAAEGNTGQLHGLHILLADDSKDNQNLIGFILRRAGATVAVVEDGVAACESALAAVTAGRTYDVILMDMQMPRLDGYDAASRLRRAGYTGPIIALTANAMSSDRARCMSVGCTDFATKPINRDRLIAQITVVARKPLAA